MKIDIFKPSIILIKICQAGIVNINSGIPKSLIYELSGGEPFQSAYDKAFSLGITCGIPVYLDDGQNEKRLLYHPDINSQDSHKEDIVKS